MLPQSFQLLKSQFLLLSSKLATDRRKKKKQQIVEALVPDPPKFDSHDPGMCREGHRGTRCRLLLLRAILGLPIGSIGVPFCDYFIRP